MMNLPLFPPPPLVVEQKGPKIYKVLPAPVHVGSMGYIEGAYRIDTFHGPYAEDSDEMAMLDILRTEITGMEMNYGDAYTVDAISPAGVLWKMRLEVIENTSGEPVRN